MIGALATEMDGDVHNCDGTTLIYANGASNNNSRKITMVMGFSILFHTKHTHPFLFECC